MKDPLRQAAEEEEGERRVREGNEKEVSSLAYLARRQQRIVVD